MLYNIAQKKNTKLKNQQQQQRINTCVFDFFKVFIVCLRFTCCNEKLYNNNNVSEATRQIIESKICVKHCWLYIL